MKLESKKIKKAHRYLFIFATGTLGVFLVPFVGVRAFTVDGIQSGVSLGDLNRNPETRSFKLQFVDEIQGMYAFIYNETDFVYFCEDKLVGYSKRIFDSSRARSLIAEGAVHQYVLPEGTTTFHSRGSIRYEHEYMWKVGDEFKGVRIFSGKGISLKELEEHSNMIDRFDFSSRFGIGYENSGIYEDHYTMFSCKK